QNVGIRRFRLEDGLLKINGERIVFKGVNRHDFGLQGRVITREETEADIRTLKALGLNAVRTSHYPNNTYFYELCESTACTSSTRKTSRPTACGIASTTRAGMKAN